MSQNTINTGGVSNNLAASNKRYVIYYAFLVVLTIVMMRPEIVEYPMAVRLVYLGLVFAPLLYAKEFTPFAVTAFYTVSYCSFVGLLPFSIIYPFVCLLLLWLTAGKKRPIPVFYFVTLFYLFMVSLLSFDFEETGVLWFGVLMAIMLSSYIKTKRDLTIFAYGFVTVSFILGVSFLLNMDHFMYAYTHSAEAMDRSGWMNPNDLGGTIGCGTVIAVGILLNGEKKSLLLRIYLVSTILVSFMALAMNASRGALVAAALGSVFFVLLNNRISLFYKIVIVALSAAFVFFLYNNSYLDLILLRFREEADEESGGGRFGIWSQKLILFKEKNVFQQLFGIGQLECISLGRHIRTHNDFVTSYLAYGITGLIIFVILLFRPVFHNFSMKKTMAISPFMAFLLIECFVLEPLMRGYFVFIAFFMFICKYAHLYQKEEL